MSEKFSEYDEKGAEIQAVLVEKLHRIERLYGIHYREPRHDIARRFLNEIIEFEPVEEVGETEEV